VHFDGAKAQNGVIQKFCTKGSQSLLSLLGQAQGKRFSFHFKCYNLTIRAVNFFETFCTCFPSNVGQELTVKITNKFYFFHLGFLS
jgi:hypothetical protein